METGVIGQVGPSAPQHVEILKVEPEFELGLVINQNPSLVVWFVKETLLKLRLVVMLVSISLYITGQTYMCTVWMNLESLTMFQDFQLIWNSIKSLSRATCFHGEMD